MRQWMSLFMALVIFAAVAVVPARADEKAAAKVEAQTDGARLVIDGAIQKVLALLKDESLKAPEKADGRRQKIRTILLEVVDMDVVGALTLANYRAKFSDEQFTRFKEEFSTLLFKTYIANLEKYSGEEVVVLKTEKITATKVTVITKIKSSDKEIPVDFGMAQKGSSWVLYDVKIEGISMVQNYREQFRELLGNQTPDKFLQRLKDKREKGE
jgi:phospholipid transport system substrate-binding protein